MRKSVIALLILGAWYLSLNFPLQAQTSVWPQFRGVNCRGIAENLQDPPVNFGTDHNLLWKTPLPGGHSSPCIWEDHIFLTGFTGEDSTLNIYCIHRKDGTILWEEKLSVDAFEPAHRVSNPATATPATDGERVVFYFSAYGLLCYDLEGEKLWERAMPVPKSRHGMGTSPVISGDLVILNCFGHINDPCLLALDKRTGGTIWKHGSTVEEGRWVDSYSTPVIHGNQVIIYRNDDVSAYDISSGDQVWRFATGTGDAVCTPVIGNGHLYFNMFTTFGNTEMRQQFVVFENLASEYDENGDYLISKEEIKGFTFKPYPEKEEVSETVELANHFGMWDSNGDAFIDSTDWNSMSDLCASYYEKQGIKCIRLGGEGDLDLDHFVWGDRDNVPHVTSPILVHNQLYVVKSGGIVTSYRAGDGSRVFSERLGASGTYFASPVSANGRIYFTSRNGVITVIEAGETLNVLARNDLDDYISATPAIVDNKIYVRTAGALLAFGE